MNRLSLGLALLILQCCEVSLCCAASYTITGLGDPSQSGAGAGFSINSSGQIAGIAGNEHAFLYDGTMHDIDTLSGPNQVSSAWSISDNGKITGYFNGGPSFLYDGTMHDLSGVLGSGVGTVGINNSGQMAGSRTIGTSIHAILYDGTVHDLGTLGGDFSAAHAINNSGQITGEARTSDGLTHAFLYDGTMHDIGTPGTGSLGLGISSNGQVTGYTETGAGPGHPIHAFLYDGTMHDIGIPGLDSYGFGVNSSGQVVGFYESETVARRAFLYDGNHGMVDLNTLIAPDSGWTVYEAYGINDAGQITGIGGYMGIGQAFLMTPVPEPSSFVLAVLVLMGLAAWGWRRKR